MTPPQRQPRNRALEIQGKTGFWQAWRQPDVLARGLRVSAVVGSLLIAINHWETLAGGALPLWWKMVLTYMVPFGVSTYSSARHAMQHHAGDQAE